MSVSRSQNNQKFRLIFDHSPNAMLLVRHHGLIELVNNAIEQLFGYHRAELIGQPLDLLVPTAFRSHHTGHQAKISAEPQNGPIKEAAEVHALHHNGSAFPAIFEVKPIETKDGVSFIVTISDISTHKQREHSLGQFAAIVASSDDAIISKTLDSIITSWNPAAERLFGYAASEAIGNPMTMVFPPDRLDEETVFLSTIARGGTIERYETERVRKDGSVAAVSVTLSPIKDQSGRIVGASKIAHDISMRRQSEQLLRHYAAIVESSEDAIIGKTLDGIITGWNLGAERIFGFRREEVVGAPIYIIIPELYRSEQMMLLERVRNGQPVSHYETVRRHKDGQLIDISVSISPIRNHVGAVVGAAAIARKLNEESLRANHLLLDAIIKLLPLGLWILDADGKIIFTNEAARHIWAIPQRDDSLQLADYKGWRPLNRPSSTADAWAGLFAAQQGKTTIDEEVEIACFDGSHKVILDSALPIRRSDGSIRGAVVLQRDITSLKQNEIRQQTLIQQLTLTNSKLDNLTSLQTAILENASCAVIACDTDLVVTLFNPAAESMLGYGSAEIIMRQTLKIFHDDEEIVARAAELTQELGIAVEPGIEVFVAKARIGHDDARQWTYIRKDGTRIAVWLTMTVLRDHSRAIVGYLAIAIDLSALHKIERELAESNELLSVTLESIGDAVITTDADGMVVWLNPVAESLIGWSRQEARGKPLAEVFVIVNAETGQPSKNPVEVCLSEGKVVGLANDTILLSRSGVEYGIEDSASPIRNGEGQLLGAVLVFHDVSEQRRMSREMSYRASHDGLTGLVNRSEFDLRLSRLLQGNNSRSHVMLYIDLDEFKVVNDTCGHAAGDQLLLQVSEIFAGRLRSRDTLARLGGDEFGVILEGCSLDEGHQIAQKICDQVEHFRFVFEGRRFRIGASIGVVPIDQRWNNSAEVMKAADSTCYAAKEAGRHRVNLWEESDDKMKARQGEAQWVNRLQSAMEDDRFILFGQRIEPIDGPNSGLHCEVLLRLAEADGTLVLPGAFLPAAERFHLASRLDRWVLKRVFTQLALTDRAMEQVEMIAVNLSGQSIADRLFQCDILRMIGEATFDVRKLCFEITETVAITNFADAQRFVDEVRALGVQIALDDFGAGASSFGYLRKLAIDILKIDGQFIIGLLDNPLDNAAVRCFCEVAKVVGAKTIAEFVERVDIRTALSRLGVDMAQGYLMHRAEPLAKLLPMMH